MPGLVLLVVGALVAIGAPMVWSRIHQDPALRSIDQGVAMQLAGARPSVTAPPDEPTAAGVATAVGSNPQSAPSTVGPPPANSQTRTSPSIQDPAARVSAAPKRESTTVRTATSMGAARSTSSPAARPVAAAMGSPVRLRIPAVAIDAAVESVGVDRNGDMSVPERVQQIGWYRFGAAPGSPAGSVVMSGHVDSAQQGLGAFARLGELKSGDPITVSDAAGRQLRYRVVGREAFDKTTAPMSALFSRAGAARLTLITCGGNFDTATRSYVDNIVVTAVPE